MIIYNVTVKVDNDVHDEWFKWMKEVHIPEVLKTGYFEHNRFYRVLVEDDDGITYSIQYQCQNIHKLEEYYEKHAPKLQQEHAERYKDKFVAFRTLLEEA